VRENLHQITLAVLAVGAASRLIVWQPASTITPEQVMAYCLLGYPGLLASYAILAAVAWFARHFRHFSLVDDFTFWREFFRIFLI